MALSPCHTNITGYGFWEKLGKNDMYNLTFDNKHKDIVKPREYRDLYALVSDTKDLLKDHVYWNIFHVVYVGLSCFQFLSFSTTVTIL